MSSLEVPVHLPKAIQDRIYDQMKFHIAICRLIDTEHVQRLRELKQLEHVHLVYPCATHTRFEHSLGVAYLAGLFLDTLFKTHKEMKIVMSLFHNTRIPMLSLSDYPEDDREHDKLCVMIAGLCHALGHGPFSRAFGRVVNDSRKSVHVQSMWSYVDQSVVMLEDMWEKNRHWLYSKEYGFKDEDLRFIKLLIRGLKKGVPWPDNVGRPPTRRFLTDIIANQRSGLDVVLLDSLNRDSLSCFGRGTAFQLKRLFQGALVMKIDEEWQICYETKVKESIACVFAERARMHRDVYQHRVCCIMEHMYVEGFQAADKVTLITHGDKEYCLSETVTNVEVFLQTTDWVEHFIRRRPEFAAAAKILDTIHNRGHHRGTGKHPPLLSGSAVNENVISNDTFKVYLGDDLSGKLLAWEEDNGRAAFHIYTSIITPTAEAIGQIGFYTVEKIDEGPRLLGSTGVNNPTEVRLILRIDIPLSTAESSELHEAFSRFLHSMQDASNMTLDTSFSSDLRTTRSGNGQPRATTPDELPGDL